MERKRKLRALTNLHTLTDQSFSIVRRKNKYRISLDCIALAFVIALKSKVILLRTKKTISKIGFRCGKK